MRYYFLKMMKDKLPDKGSPYEGEGGDVTDAVDFILQNLSEMNRLWVRMQHINTHKNKEVERGELRVTVGENIIRLSSLEGLTFEIYRQTVLPKLLEVTTICKDTLAQQYLMDCLIQAFPDEYHLQTLDPLLEATTKLNAKVDIKAIFINLMDKLSKYASSQETHAGLSKDMDIFALFKKYIDKLVEEQGKVIEVGKILELQVAFLKFSIKMYPNDIGHVNDILESCVAAIKASGSGPEKPLDAAAMKHLEKLLSKPLSTLNLAILDMNNYPALMQYMKFNNRRKVALRIVQAVIVAKKGSYLESLEIVEQLIGFIMPLLQDETDAEPEDPSDFERGQESVSKLLHIIFCNDLDQQFEILTVLKKIFVKGGQKRLKYMVPPLCFCLFKLSRSLEYAMHRQGTAPAPVENYGEGAEGEEEKKQAPAPPPQLTWSKIDQYKIFKMVNEMIAKISQNYPEVSLRLYLQATEAVNLLSQPGDIEELCYEFASQSLIIYQEELTEIESKFAAINLIVSTLYNITCFGHENFDTLVSNSLQYCGKLLKKPSQCEAMTIATSLYYCFFLKDGNKVMDYLKKALRVADVSMSSPKNLYLFVQLLNKYLYFFSIDAPFVTAEDIGNLSELLTEHISGIDEKDDEAVKRAIKYLENTRKSVAIKKAAMPDKWNAITI